jgi:hypothetical protein
MLPSWSSSSNCGMRNCWSMSVQIHDTGNGRLHEEEGAVHCYVHQTCCVLLHYDSSRRCVCLLYKFVYTFKVVKFFLEHPIYGVSNF